MLYWCMSLFGKHTSFHSPPSKKTEERKRTEKKGEEKASQEVSADRRCRLPDAKLGHRTGG
ncbi:hypothetical protein HanRHA438_Chr04g0201531 [Helianthus annuus]|nr:hypothetical protein HanHA300_Chr04g0157501 [Helianthus annuus]KAJ0598917.1 hypothetical protein HanHA89_Chr04g0170971 [Helianthus annuus]KAJ0763156.1 hypothetical protein HanOQP8_Chr04g0169121 [Helianthus annuus]KAJ0929125.1 hypothetical protein HanRHA438_Chr04g0201531 [Helianthus annuus]